MSSSRSRPRSLNRSIEIIARGEVPSTEKKLRHAGADKVVLPTHIGAERIAEMILYPESTPSARDTDKSREFERKLNSLGLQMEVIVAADGGAFTGKTVGEIEQGAKGAFFIVQLKYRSGKTITKPPADTRIEIGDGVVLVGRDGLAAWAG